MKESGFLGGRGDLLFKLGKLTFLQSFKNDYLQDILKLSKLRSYQAEEIITREGGFDSTIYVLINGDVKVEKKGSEIARLDQPGEAFGELSVLDGKARSATVIATSETLCLAIDSSFLNRLKAGEQQAVYAVFYRLLAEILCHRLRETNEELVRCKTIIQDLEQEKEQEKDPATRKMP